MKHPFVQFICIESCSESIEKIILSSFIEKDLFWLKTVEQLVNIFNISLGCKKLSGRNIKECNTCNGFLKVNARKEIVLLMFQYIFVKCHTGGNKLSNAPFYYFFCQFRIFELFAYRNPLSCPDKFWQVIFYCMVRKAGQFHI